ncbi:MAG: anaerobic sulfite reductase subunit AsrB [Vibrio sp.]
MSCENKCPDCTCGEHDHDHDHDNTLMPKAYSILRIMKHTENEWNFRVQRDFDVHFGQFVEVSLPMIGEAPISVSDYGTDDNGEDYVDLMIRNVGKVTNELFQLKPGNKVWMRGVHGNGYPMDVYQGKHMIVVAGGTGVAPVKGLMNHFCYYPEKIARMDMILGFKNTDAVLYKEELREWAQVQNLIPTLDEESKDDFYQTGLVTAHLNSLDYSDIDNIQAIVVGPPIMIKFTVQGLLAKGLKKEQIWVDYERRMACAVGKCGHCRIGEKYVCVDGPVFRFDQAEDMMD